jgi:hypothetical protein
MRLAFLKSRPLAGRRASLCVLAAVAGLSFAAPARADVGEAIINKCVHGQPLGGFSPSAYNRALKELNSEEEEYSDCSSLIRQAELAAAGGGSTGGGAIPVPVPSTPAEQRSIARATHAGSAPVQVGSQVIHPGVVHVNIASALSSLPTPLLATAAFLLACLLMVAGGVLRNRVRAHRAD